jgi:outer membrane immunogenic protein
MKKKLLAAALLSAATTGAMAQSAFEGGYGQIGIGYESTSVSFSGGTISGVGYSATANNSNSFTGAIGVGGYFPVSQSFLIGIGAEYNPIPGSSADYTLTVPAAAFSETGTYKKKDSYNIFVSPALAIDKDKLAYAKVGFTGANIETSASGQTDTTSYTGYSLGLGYRQIIQGGLYGFIETNYAAYSSKNDGAGATGTNKPTTMNVMLGVGYKF